MKTLTKRLTLEQGKVTKELYDPKKEAISLLKSTSSPAKFDESMEASHLLLLIQNIQINNYVRLLSYLMVPVNLFVLRL